MVGKFYDDMVAAIDAEWIANNLCKLYENYEELPCDVRAFLSDPKLDASNYEWVAESIGKDLRMTESEWIYDCDWGKAGENE